MITRAQAPGKIILSGEHSVVYGAPAIVAAVSEYTQISFTPHHHSHSINTAFQGISKGKPYPLKALKTLKNKLDQRFEQFIRGERPVNHILHRPDDLAIYTLATLLQHLPALGTNQHRPTAGRLNSHTTLPLGAGMGSSAAAIAATLVLYEHMLNLPLTPKQRFERVRFCERLQHGKGSAIDATASVYGGLHYLYNQQPTAINTALTHHWYWVLHGIPQSSTGECVHHVRKHHSHDTPLWQAFSDCSQNLLNALEKQSDPQESLRENHQLLNRIGVVPQSANHFLNTLNAHGGSGKLSGAGSIRGEQAGILLIYHPDPQQFTHFMQHHHPTLPYKPLKLTFNGAHILPHPSAPPQQP